MAKKSDDELDLDLDDLGLDEDLDMFSDSEDSFSDKPKKNRDPVLNAVTDGFKGFSNSLTDDAMKTATDIAASAIPSSLSSEKSNIDDTVSTLKEEILNATKEIRQAGASTLSAVDKLIPDDSVLKKYSGKFLGLLSDSNNDVVEQVSKEQRQNVEISQNILSSLGEQSKIEAQTLAIREQIASVRHKSSQEIMASILVNVEKDREFNTTITNAYFRRSLELQYKSLFTAKEQLDVIKSGFNNFTNQFESIIKNTGLPDIVKLKTSEQIGENIGFRAREKFADFLQTEVNPFQNLRDNATTKIKSFKDSILESLGLVTEVSDGVGMMNEMGSFGMSRSNLAGGMLADWVKNKIGESIGSKFEDSEAGKDHIYKIKNNMLNPEQFLLDQANQTDSSTMLGGMKSSAYNNLASLFNKTDKKDLLTLNKNNPDEPAIFDYRVHNSIVKTIPGLLSKIYAEVKSIRTGEDPIKNEIHYDHFSDTFKTKDVLKKEFKNNARKVMSNNIGAPLISFFSRLFPKGTKVDKNHEQLISNALLQYLMETKNIAPDGLLNGEKNLLTYLPKGLRKETGKYLKAMLAQARDEPYFLDSISSDLKRIIEGVPSFTSNTSELYKNGLKSVGEDLGLLKTNQVTGQSVLDKDSVSKFVLDNHNEYGLEGIRKDIKDRDLFNSRYGIKSKDDLYNAQKALDAEKRLNPRTKKTLEDFLKEHQTNFKNSDAYKYANTKITNLDNEYNISNTAGEYYNTNLNELGSKIEKDILEKLENNEYVKTAREKADSITNTLTESKAFKEAKETTDKLDKEYKVSRKSKLFIKKLFRGVSNSETFKDLESQIDKIKNLEELKEFNKTIEENAIVNNIKTTVNEIGNSSLHSNVDNIDRKIKAVKRKAVIKSLRVKNKIVNSDIKKDLELIKNEANGDVSKIPDIIKKNNLDVKYKEATENLYKEALKQTTNTSNNIHTEFDNYLKIAKEKFSPKNIKVNVGTLTPDKIENLNRLAPANNIKFVPKELREITDEEENEYRTVYLNSDIDREKISFEEYLKSFGVKSKDSLLSKLNFIKGIKNLYTRQFNKKVTDNLDKGKELIKLKKVSKDDEATLRFEFYNSPEYKAGLITDFHTWLKDKGLRNEEMFSIKTLLRKTREWDKKIFKATVGNAVKAVKNIPWAAKNSLKFGSMALKPFTSLGKYALDGALSTVGLDFMGIGDKGTRGLDKKIAKGTLNTVAKAPGALSKIGSLFGKGVEKGKSLDWGILNPFNSLKEEDINVDKFKKKHQKKMDRDKRLEELRAKREAKQNKSKPTKAFNDSDGDGNRDGDWKSRFGLFGKKKKDDTKIDIKAPEKDSDSFGLLKMLGFAIPALVSLGKNMLSSLLDIPKLLTWMGKGIFNIPKFLTNIASKITSLPGLLTGAMGIGKSILDTGSKFISGAIETGGKLLSAGGKMVESVTPEAVKAFFSKIKDAILKKLGPKAGGKLMLSFGAKIASRLVPVAGLALLAYDAAMITADILKNGTDFKSAVSKQLIGFDIFNPGEPALDEDGNPIKPDEQFTKEDMAEKLSDKEKAALTDEGNGKTEKDWFDKMYEDVKSASSSAYDKAKEMGSNAVDYTKDAYDKVSTKASELYNDTKDTVAKAYDSTKKALGGLVGSIPMPTGKGTWQALKDTIMSASKAAGVDDKLMAIMAAVESGFDYTIKAGTSSAKGLYQFLDGTWNTVVKQFGGKYGIDSSVPATDPRANALMGAEFMKQNAEVLRSQVNRPLTYTDIYLAHFLGSSGAKKFIKELEKDPNQNASLLFPGPASSNKNIFYVNGDTSKPRTLSAIYSHFTNLLDNKAKSFNIDIASSGETKPPVDSNTIATTQTNTNNNSSASSETPIVNANSTDVNINKPKENLENKNVNTSVSNNSGNNNLGSYTDKASLANTETAVASNNFNMENNKTLTTISSTLEESLKVQIRIADALDKISTFDNRDKNIPLAEINKSNVEKDKVNNVPATNINNSEFIEPAINLQRKKY